MPVSMPPLPLFAIDSRDEAAQASKFEKSDGATRSAIGYFRAHAAGISTPDALLKDYRSLQVVLEAFGMPQEIRATGLLRKLMTQDPADPSSVAQRTANPRYLRFAEFMSNWQPPPLSDPQAVEALIGQFATVRFETDQGKKSPGLQQALYFRRTIGAATSIQQIMSDPTLLQVVRVASGLPQQFGLLGYAQQLSLLSKNVDLSALRNQTDIDKYARRYLVMTQMNGAATPTAGADPVLALFPGSGGAATGSDANALLSVIAGFLLSTLA